jgi:hypothetical protein
MSIEALQNKIVVVQKAHRFMNRLSINDDFAVGQCSDCYGHPGTAVEIPGWGDHMASASISAVQETKSVSWLGTWPEIRDFKRSRS